MTARRTSWEERRLRELADRQALREEADPAVCPKCLRGPGYVCVNPLTQEEHRAPAHWQRINAAKVLRTQAQ